MSKGQSYVNNSLGSVIISDSVATICLFSLAGPKNLSTLGFLWIHFGKYLSAFLQVEKYRIIISEDSTKKAQRRLLLK